MQFVHLLPFWSSFVGALTTGRHDSSQAAKDMIPATRKQQPKHLACRLEAFWVVVVEMHLLG
jgi:hypothetical protein